MPGSFTINGSRPSLVELAARLLIATVVAVAVVGVFRREIVQWLLPAFRFVLEAIDSQFNILILDVTDRKLDQVVRLRVELARTVVMNSHVTRPTPGGWLEVTTTLGTVLQSGLTAFITAAAWPAARAGEFMARMFAAVVLGLFLILFDAPIDLLAYVWDMFIYSFDPQGFYPIWKYHEFMIGGGRFALGTIAGAVAIVGTARVFSLAERRIVADSHNDLGQAQARFDRA